MKRTELLNALKMVIPGIGDKNVLLEGSNSFMFDGDWIKTFNDEISVSFPFKTDVKCLIKANEFFRVLSKMDSEDVKMIMLDDGKLRMSGGKTVLKMTSLDTSSFTALVNNLSLSEVKWKNLPEKFLEALDVCSGFASKNTAFAALCGISIGDDGLTASDRTRAGFYRISMRVREPFVLKAEAAKELVKSATISQFSVEDNWVHFRDKDGVCFSVRKYKVEFPRDAVKNFMNFSDVGAEYSFPEGLAKIIDRVSELAYSTGEGNEYVALSLDNKGSLIVSGSKGFGEIEDKIAKDKDWSFPEDMKIQINPACFLSILSMGRKFYIKDGKFLLMKNGDLESVIALVSLG